MSPRGRGESGTGEFVADKIAALSRKTDLQLLLAAGAGSESAPQHLGSHRSHPHHATPVSVLAEGDAEGVDFNTPRASRSWDYPKAKAELLRLEHQLFEEKRQRGMEQQALFGSRERVRVEELAPKDAPFAHALLASREVEC